jgi:hypothetical protein
MKRKSKSKMISKGSKKSKKGGPLTRDPATGLVGLGRSGRKDLSLEHDKYLVKNIITKTKGV